MDVRSFDGIQSDEHEEGGWVDRSEPHCSHSCRYTLLEQLGASPGRSSILARDEVDGAYVVMKVIDVPDDGRLRAGALDELRARADVLSNVRHPHIARLQEWFEFRDETGSHRFAFVWEFVEGESVRRAHETGRTFSDAEVASVAEDVLSALSHLHAQGPGALHGRVSCGNVIVSTAADGLGRLCGGRAVACLVDLELAVDWDDGACDDPTPQVFRWLARGDAPRKQILPRLEPRRARRAELVLLAGVLLLMRTGRVPLLTTDRGWRSRWWWQRGGCVNIEEAYLEEGVRPDFGLLTVLFRMGQMREQRGHVFPLDCEAVWWDCPRITGCTTRGLMKIRRRCTRGCRSADEALQLLWKLDARETGPYAQVVSWDALDLPRERHPLLRSACQDHRALTIGWVEKRGMRCWPGWRVVLFLLYYLVVCLVVFTPAVMLQPDDWWKWCVVLFGFVPFWLLGSLVTDVAIKRRHDSLRKLFFLCGSLMWWGMETLCQVPSMVVLLVVDRRPFDYHINLLFLFLWVFLLAVVDAALMSRVGREGFAIMGDWLLAEAKWYKIGGPKGSARRYDRCPRRPRRQLYL